MKLVCLLALAPLIVAVSGGCSSTSSPTIVRCQDGDRRDCTGPDGCEGAKVCANEEWGDCVCSAGAGGTAGNGGDGATTSGATNGGTSSTGGSNGTSGGTGGGSAGSGGSGGGNGTDTGGSSGSAGSGGTAGGGGSSGSGTGGANSGGNGGTGGETACPVDDTRCGQAGRERCNGDAWVSEPCPLDTPACEQGECVLRGPSMVHVGSFYIDSTEVTVAQYREFLDYKGNDSSGQIDECSWNTAYWEDGRVFNSDSWPINWVDWCDAAAFCDWAGKRLCGRIGGGSINDDDFYDPTESEWILACGGPNGNSHVNGNWDCNTNGSNGYLEPVGSFEGCEGWYEGLFDMEGNVFEWTDNCVGEDGATDVCRLAGGSYVDSGSYCTRLLAEYSRDTTANPFGFRCCND